MKAHIEFKVNDVTLRGNFYEPNSDRAQCALLFLHGWTGRPNEAAASFLADYGFISLTFSLSGHRPSDGNLEDQTRQKSLQEVSAAYDLLRSKTELPIVAVGNSYGGYLAAILSRERPLVAMSLRVPANYPDETFNNAQMGQGSENLAVMQWRQIVYDFQTTRALQAVHDFAGPVQIIEAELDIHVPHPVIESYCRAVQTNKMLDYHIMKGWPHSIGSDSSREAQFEQVLLSWLQQKV